MNRSLHTTLLAGAAGALLAGAPAASADATVTFDNGPEGWSINGWDEITPMGGNPGAHIRLQLLETFGISVRNTTNPEFIGDYAKKGPVRLGADFDVNFIRFFGSDVTREIIVELRDYDNPPENYPYVSVYFFFGELPAPEAGWESYSVDIEDPAAAELPEGWGGTGAEDPETFEPMLPPDRTFASVLAGVDEIVWTTFVPGFFYGFTDFDIKVDNLVIESLGGNPADLDGDGAVGASDLALLLGSWGACASCPADLDDDGVVGASDLAIMLGSWG